jgi:hypothetical protein
VKSIESFLNNYEPLHKALLDVSDSSTNDTGAKASGYLKKLESFETFFGLSASLAVLEHAEKCNMLVQST